MTRALALPLILLPGIAAADVTPQDVWDNITATYANMGLTMTGTPVVDGDALVVNGAALEASFPIIGGGFSMTWPDTRLAAQGDGTVAISVPTTYAIDFSASVPGQSEVTGALTIAQEGPPTIASGDPGDVTYVTDVDNFDMIFNGLILDGEPMDISVQADSDGYAATTRIVQALDGTITLTTNYLSRTTQTAVAFEFEGIAQNSTSDAGDLTTDMTLVLPPDMSILNLTPGFAAGLSLIADVQTNGSTSETTTTMDGAPMSQQSQTVGPTTARFALDQDGLRLSGEGTTFAADIVDQSILPFPISIAGETFSYEFAVPTVAREDAQGFVYAFNLSGLTIDDMLWSMVDPAGTLNRDPLALGIDVRGMLNWGLNTFDFAMYEALAATGEVPITVEAVDIRDISLAALGAMAKVTGDFTFDNDDMQTFPGFPRPEGAAIVEASGLNAAIDQLLAAGLISESDVGPARMMMGMFTRVTGDDSIETTVEVNGDGHVIVNGQRMR